jgi:hypothetical protein
MSLIDERLRSPLLREVDEALSKQRPFGDSEHIADRLKAVYERRLVKLSDRFPRAGELVDRLMYAEPERARRVLADTTVRTIIDHLRRAAATGTSGAYRLTPIPLCEEVLEALLDYVRTGSGSGPLNLTTDPRAGNSPYHPWIWVDDRPANDPFARAYRWLIEAHYGGMPRPVRDVEVQAIRQGAELVEELLPFSAPSVMGHTQVVAIIPASGVWEKMQSSSQYLLGGNIFLSELVLNKPWLIAELLYHESIHQKLYDFRHGHSVLKEDATLDPDTLEKSTVLVQSPWNFPDNEWDTHRVLAAFHVYVHISLLSLCSEERSAELEALYGPRMGQTPVRSALDRAHYLGEKLTEERCWEELDEGGRRLVEWLLAILGALEKDSPPRGAVLHLLLNRYEREGQRVARKEHVGEVSYLAEVLAQDEPRIILRLLEDLRLDPTASQLRKSLAWVKTRDPHARFVEVRGCILQTLRSLGDRYSLPEVDSVDGAAVVSRMIERSSRLLVLGEELETLEGPEISALLMQSRVPA